MVGTRRLPRGVKLSSMRKQVFLPEFTISLIRTPFLPPRYASFYVPLSFNKLDLRDYLRRVYGVKVLGIRSYVEQQNVTRLRRDGSGYGPLRRPKSKKRMTVELVESFVWPDVPKDLGPWEKDQYYKAAQYQEEKQREQQPKSAMDPNKVERKAYEKQATELLEGKQTWRPTWQALGLSYDRTAIVDPRKPSTGPRV